MNRIRYTILQLILDRCRAQQEHILLDQLRRLVKRISTTIDGRSGLLVNSRPLRVLGFWYISGCQTQRSEPISCVVLLNQLKSGCDETKYDATSR